MSSRKPKAKKTGKLDNLLQQVEGFITPWQKRLTDFIQTWEKARDITRNNYELGLRHLLLGNLNDAVLRFKLVTWLDPKHALAWYYLGCSYLADNKPVLAQKAFRTCLQLTPDFAEANYMLAVASKGRMPVSQLPRKMPVTLAKTHFEGLAADYNQEQLETQRYQGHMLLTNAARTYLTRGRMNYTVLELGVGTGLVGPLMRDIAVEIIGVDLSPAMLAEAAKLFANDGRRIYDVLIQRELHEYLQAQPLESAEIILAANVVSYIGDLQSLFALVAQVLKSGGIFGFTAEKLAVEQEADFRFDPSAGLFRYSLAYLRQLAAANGLQELMAEEGQMYPEKNAWLCVFAKP